MPLVYSTIEAEKNSLGWYRAGYDIAYYQNNQPYCKIFGEGTGDGKGGANSGASQSSGAKSAAANAGFVAANQKEPTALYTLSFKFSLKHDKDDVYIAMCYPYTLTDMLAFTDSIFKQPESPTILRRTTLCKTLAGNNLEMLIITNFSAT